MISQYRRTITQTLILLLLSLLMVGQGFAQQGVGPAEVIIITPPAFIQDELTMQLVVKERSGFTIADLTAPNFSVSEGANDLQVRADRTLPIAMGVVVDLSRGAEVPLIQDALRAYFGVYYRAEDRVTLYLLGPDATAPVVTEITSFTQISNLINGLTSSNNSYELDGVLSMALGNLRLQPNLPRHMLYVGSRLDDKTAVDAAALFVQDNIPLHVVRVYRNPQSDTAVFQRLPAGGLYVENLNGTATSIVEEGTPTAIGILKVLYDSLSDSRVVYTLTYRPAQLASSRAVTLTVTLTNGTPVTLDFSYDRQLIPPNVEILSPLAGFSFLRRPFWNGDDVGFDLQQERVEVRVTFPDESPRPIEALGLKVFDASNGSLVLSQTITAPERDENGNFTIIWPLDIYSIPQSDTLVRLAVTAKDSFGLIGIGEIAGEVSVAFLPPQPTATLPPTAVPTIQPTAVATTASQTTTSTAVSFTNSPVVLILVGVVGILVLVALLLYLRLRRIQARQAALQRQLMMQPQIVEVPIQPQPLSHTETNHQPQNSDKPLYGRLFILKGLEPREIRIDSEQFVIGRAPEGECNFTIDMPYVSPKHCMIIHHDGRFSIRDLGGKNGTFVNGERISRDRDTAAPVGSEIGITKNITMELWDMETVISLESKLTSAAGMSTAVRSTERGDELRFKSVLGIKQADDEEDIIPEDYSPV
jgi:hypothetical protein